VTSIDQSVSNEQFEVASQVPLSSSSCLRKGINCTVYVTNDTAKCLDGMSCYTLLEEALNEIGDDQRVELLDEVVVMQSISFVQSIQNITIYSLIGTQITMSPASAEVNGPFLVFTHCDKITLSGVIIKDVIVSETLIFFSFGNGIVFENFRCEKVLLRLRTVETSFPGGCIGGRYVENMRIHNSVFKSAHLHSSNSGRMAQGSAVALLGTSLYVTDSIFEDNMAVADSAYGGAIYMRNGYLSFRNVTFSGNRVTTVSEGAGGAVYLYGGSLDIISCRFFNNSIITVEPMANAFGGAIYMLAKPVFPSLRSYYASLAATSFHGNEIKGVGDFEGGAVALGARSVLIHKCDFIRNRIWSPTLVDGVSGRSSLSVRGGAAKIMAQEFMLLENIFDSNTAAASQGYTPGWAYGAAADLVTDRFAQGASAGQFTLRNNNFTNNAAFGGLSTEDNSGGGAFGGAVRLVALDTIVTVQRNEFYRNVAVAGDGPISGGTAQGGALVINHLSYLSPLGIPYPSYSLDYDPLDEIIGKNPPTSNQSMAKETLEPINRLKSASHPHWHSDALINHQLHEESFHAHADTVTSVLPDAQSARVKIVANRRLSPISDRSAYFMPLNSTKRMAASEVYLSGNFFTENSLMGGVGSMLGGDAAGGALYFEGSMMSLKECQFSQNEASGGDTKDSAIGANTGGAGKGGAVYVHQFASNVTISKAIFELNKAQGGHGWSEPSRYSPLQYGRGGMAFGGAIASWAVLMSTGRHVIHLQDSYFWSNHARGGSSYLNSGEGIGGAIWASRVEADRCQFLANYAANGGAVYSTELNVTQCSFLYNSAKATTETDAVGGAIFSFHANVVETKFSQNVVVTLFSRGNAVGGAIHTEQHLHLLRSNFSENCALTSFTTAQGGAVAASNRTIIEDCSFVNNSALPLTGDTGFGQGGSIYLDIFHSEPSLLQNVYIHSSKASYGGGLYLRGLNAHNVDWRDIDVANNTAAEAGGGVAFLPLFWSGGVISGNLCPTCVFQHNSAASYGDDIISPYMAIVGNTSALTNPGLSFSAAFTVVDFTLNTVKQRGLGVVLTPPKDTLFQSGIWQNEQAMNLDTGRVSFPTMTAWGQPNDQFGLNFTLVAPYLGDFGSPGRIALEVNYQLAACPAGHRLDTSTSYTSCQQCPAGLYGFGSDCETCPDDEFCAITPLDGVTADPDPLIYRVEAGFVPSPRTNPIAVLRCPYITTNKGSPKSSCLPSVCTTDCGPERHLTSSPSFTPDIQMNDEWINFSPFRSSSRPFGTWQSSSTTMRTMTLPNCTIQCGENNCAAGHTGFLCSQCVCDGALGCWYPADDHCHKCNYSWRPTVIVFSVAVILFILLKGTLLVICMGLYSICVTIMLFFDLISTIIPSIFGTAFIIFAEAQRGSSSGLIKSFVFFMQTVSVFIAPEVMPTQLVKLSSLRVLTQFRVFGLECLSKDLFGNPFQRFIFAMLLPLVLLLLVCALYWLCELLRMIRFFRALQDFDPFEHISFFRARLHRSRPTSDFSLLKDEPRSESEMAMATGEISGGYLSDLGPNDMSSWISAETDYLEAKEALTWREYVQFMNWKVGRVALFLIFAAHFELCSRILEVFAPCVSVPSEGFSYSSTHPWLVCAQANAGISFFSPHTTHGKMAISGLLFGVLYIIGVPLGFAVLLYWKRQEIKAGDSSTGRWLGLLYNSYRPSLHYFELAWLFRRIVFAAVISVIPSPFVSRYLAPACVLFISLLIQRAYKPFIFKSDNNMEVISLLTILFAIFANAVITARSASSDAVVWRWLNFFIITFTLIAFLYKLFKPFLLFLRPLPNED
jgi:hypothetical protein